MNLHGNYKFARRLPLPPLAGGRAKRVGNWEGGTCMAGYFVELENACHAR